MADLKLSICIPAYNGAKLIGETLESILRQSFGDYEVIVCDDCSTDNTVDVVQSFGDSRIRCYRNSANLGYGKNLQVCCERAQNDILFLMGQDDVLLKDALLKTHNAFKRGDEIGVVTRPYYWFYEDVRMPVRAVRPYNASADSVLSVFGGERHIAALFESAGQLSGLAYRREYIDTPFHEETFPAHIYPFAAVLRKYKAVYLKDYTVAVQIESSQTRHKSSIYDISPTQSWVRMFDTVYAGEELKTVREQCVDFITGTNFVGLAQLKNYSTMKVVIREILLLVKYRWRNLFEINFWLFSLGAVVIPRSVLRRMVDSYKKSVLSGRLKDIAIEL